MLYSRTADGSIAPERRPVVASRFGGAVHTRSVGHAMAVSVSKLLPLAICLAACGVGGLVLAEPSASDRPYLAKDVNEAMKFLGEWARVSSGQEFFAGATYVGSQACGGSGCHDQQVSEWK